MSAEGGRKASPVQWPRPPSLAPAGQFTLGEVVSHRLTGGVAKNVALHPLRRYAPAHLRAKSRRCAAVALRNAPAGAALATRGALTLRGQSVIARPRQWPWQSFARPDFRLPRRFAPRDDTGHPQSLPLEGKVPSVARRMRCPPKTAGKPPLSNGPGHLLLPLRGNSPWGRWSATG